LSREIFNYFHFPLNWFLFRSIVPQFPSQFSLARLVTTAEVLEAIKKAGTSGYRSLTAAASAADARP
jgi:hypothetical protein